MSRLSQLDVRNIWLRLKRELPVGTLVSVSYHRVNDNMEIHARRGAKCTTTSFAFHPGEETDARIAIVWDQVLRDLLG
jgi:hypothetical protein